MKNTINTLSLVVMGAAIVAIAGSLACQAWLSGIYSFPMTPAYFELVDGMRTLETVAGLFAVVSLFVASATKES